MTRSSLVSLAFRFCSAIPRIINDTVGLSTRIIWSFGNWNILNAILFLRIIFPNEDSQGTHTMFVLVSKEHSVIRSVKLCISFQSISDGLSFDKNATILSIASLSLSSIKHVCCTGSKLRKYEKKREWEFEIVKTINRKLKKAPLVIHYNKQYTDQFGLDQRSPLCSTEDQGSEGQSETDCLGA